MKRISATGDRDDSLLCVGNQMRAFDGGIWASRRSTTAKMVSGYTLAEMLIAMVLVSALMSAVWGIMSLYNGLLTAGRDRTSEIQLVRSLFEVVHEDLASVNVRAAPPSLDEFDEVSDGSVSSGESDSGADFAMRSPEENMPARLSLTGSSTAMRLQMRLSLPPDLNPSSDIDLLNELGGGSVSSQQNSRTETEFKTVIYQLVRQSQQETVNAAASHAPGLYRIQLDTQSMGTIEAGESTAKQFRKLDPIELSRQNLTVLIDSPNNASSEEQLWGPMIPLAQVDIIPEIVECRFEYFDGTVWQSAWKADHVRRIPLAVRVTFDVVGQADLAQLSELYSPADTLMEDVDDATSMPSVSARRYSRTILLDSTGGTRSGGSR